MSIYIAKTPAIIVTNIRSTKETVVSMPTVSVKKRGDDWSESETFTVTQTQVEGRGSNLKEAMNNMWEKWDKFTAETFGESIYVEKHSDEWVKLQQ